MCPITLLLTIFQLGSATQLLGCRPDSKHIETFLASIASRSHNHDFVGLVSISEDTTRPLRGLRPLELRRLEYVATLGHGRPCYRRARRQLLEWRMHEGGDSSVHTRGRIDDPLATLAPMPHPKRAWCWVLNPCRVTVRECGRQASAVGYATLNGHLIAGEERMSVVLDPRSGEVSFRVVSLSRGAGAHGRLLFPWLGGSQRRFFREQVDCMVRSAAQRAIN